MDQVKGYYPCFTSREGEIRALAALAEPTKDLIFPIVRLQAWPRSKAEAGGPLERSLEQLRTAFGTRSFALDLALPRTDLDSEWGLQGSAELASISSEENGFENWCVLAENNEQIVPVVQWSNDPTTMIAQITRLSGLNRGLVLRFKRSQNWNLGQVVNLLNFDFAGYNLLLVFDCEQLGPNEDLTAVGTMAQNAMLVVNDTITTGTKTLVLSGSSFPSSFADIDPTYADLPMRERQLYEMVRQSPPLLAKGFDLKYGDHAAVFAAERPPAFKGTPRVDYPTDIGWIYHRCPEGFALAVSRVVDDAQWNDDLLCWGAQRIRTAADGDMTGLGSQLPWVAIRINIHLHLQAHFGSGAVTPVEEDWTD